MAEYLGKPRVKSEDLVTSLRNAPMFTRYFEQNHLARVYLIIPSDLLKRFQEAVTKRYGAFSAGKAKTAVEEAVRKWIEDVEK
jgi:hypothetical protein